MAVFIKPNRWTRQPPYNAGVDWNNPLTAGIRNLWNMSQRGMVDAVGNANGTPIGGVGLAGHDAATSSGMSLMKNKSVLAVWPFWSVTSMK